MRICAAAGYPLLKKRQAVVISQTHFSWSEHVWLRLKQQAERAHDQCLDFALLCFTLFSSHPPPWEQRVLFLHFGLFGVIGSFWLEDLLGLNCLWNVRAWPLITRQVALCSQFRAQRACLGWWKYSGIFRSQLQHVHNVCERDFGLFSHKQLPACEIRSLAWWNPPWRC